MFRVTTFGESHGKALGAIIDGCPPGLQLSEADLQPDLDRRKPGQSKYTTQRRESDEVQILSGVFEGVTTGTPMGYWCLTRIKRAKIIRPLKTLTGRHTRTSRINKSMVFATIAAVAVLLRGRPLCGLPLVR